MDSGTIDFLGIGFSRCGLAEALDWVREAAEGATFRYVVTPNVDHVVMLGTATQEWSENYREALRASDLCLNDSRVLQRLAGLDGIALPVAPGSDLVRLMVAARAAATGSIALVGGSGPRGEMAPPCPAPTSDLSP